MIISTGIQGDFVIANIPLSVQAVGAFRLCNANAGGFKPGQTQRTEMCSQKNHVSKMTRDF